MPFGKPARLCVYLRSVQGIPLARLSHVLARPVRPDISEGAVGSNIFRRQPRAFCDADEPDQGAAPGGPPAVGASDETGMRVGQGALVALRVFHQRRAGAVSRRQTTAPSGCACFLGDAPGFTGFRTAMAARWLGTRGISLPRASHRDVQYADRTLATRCSPPGRRACPQARLRPSGSTRRSYRRTLKIYEADLNGRLDRLMS